MTCFINALATSKRQQIGRYQSSVTCLLITLHLHQTTSCVVSTSQVNNKKTRQLQDALLFPQPPSPPHHLATNVGRESVSTIEPRGNSVSEVAARLFCSKSDYMPLANGLGDPYECRRLMPLVDCCIEISGRSCSRLSNCQGLSGIRYRPSSSQPEVKFGAVCRSASKHSMRGTRRELEPSGQYVWSAVAAV
eukprot:scaffold43743_cov70-Cyclotella_meneghiniana.AAC.1